MRNACYLFFETLATKLKADIITALKGNPLTVNELSRQLKQERSKVSHALISLRECGFVEFKKEGRNRIYSLNKKTILPLLNLVEKHVKRYCKICRKS
ncbi:MAG: helix-turn-helix domain-containing protein [Candidatus Diapherotrites archaeon]